MAKGLLKHIVIKGMACAVPKKRVFASDYYESLGQDIVDKFVSMAGVKERYVGEGKVISSDLCYAAAEKLFSEFGFDRSSIDALIFVTQTPDYRLPATACVLQYRLKLPTDCMALDVNLGCSGYVYGLHLAASYLQGGNIKRVLLLVGDSNLLSSPEDKSQAMMFGDAGSATIIDRDENAGDMEFLFSTDGSGYKHLVVPCGGFRHREGNNERTDRGDGIIRSDFETHMDGTEIFNFTISQVPKALKAFFEYHKTGPETYDLFILHQANLFMLNYIAKKSKIPVEKLPISLDRYGNTSSASIPVTICDYMPHSGVDKVYKLAMAGFGVGLSLGIVSMEIDKNVCLPIFAANEIFEDGLL